MSTQQPEITRPLSTKQSSVSSLGWIIFATGILYYCFAYLLRVYPNVMESQLLEHFTITATSFGWLTSFYYFAYAPMQIPVGLTVDRLGPRRALLVGCCLSIFGVYLFAHTSIFAIALVGRFLIGLGAAFAYVTALKIASVWLPQRFFATATGAVTGGGMIAAIFTELFLTHMVATQGYEHALYFPMAVGLVLLVLIALFVRDKKQGDDAVDEEASATNAGQLVSYLKTIMCSRQMWTIGLVGALLYLPSSVFLDVWGIPYLETVHHLTAQAAAKGVSVMLGGWIISSFATGALSDLLGTRKVPLVIASFGAAALSSIILFSPHLSENILYMLLFLLGVFCGPHPLCFTLSKENNPGHIAGTAVSFANFVIMMGGFVFQPAIGRLLDLGWTGGMHGDIRIYSIHDYTMSLSVLPAALLLAGILILTVRETFKR